MPIPEPTTIGLGAIAAYLSKDGLQKLLGPTAEYLGEGLKDFTQRRAENIGRIFSNAEKKLGDRIDSKGEVPPRVLKEIINEGSFFDDELASEYFGGILASSRTELGRDDRGARLSKVIDSLSTYQIRTHYLLYSSIKHLFSKSALPFNMEGRPKMQIYLPLPGFIHAMDFDEIEALRITQLLNHIFFGLASEDLIDASFWQYGPKENIMKIYADASVDGIICGPSAFGAELFLWAFGHSNQDHEYIFHDKFCCDVKGLEPFVHGVEATKKL